MVVKTNIDDDKWPLFVTVCMESDIGDNWYNKGDNTYDCLIVSRRHQQIVKRRDTRASKYRQITKPSPYYRRGNESRKFLRLA